MEYTCSYFYFFPISFCDQINISCTYLIELTYSQQYLLSEDENKKKIQFNDLSVTEKCVNLIVKLSKTDPLRL